MADKNKLKKVVAALIALLLLLTLCGFVFAFFGSSISDWFFVHSNKPDISFAQESLTVEIGSLTVPKLCGDERFIERTELESSDEAVIRIDENGALVAVGSGNCVVTASVFKHKTELSVAVEGDMISEVQNAVKALASGSSLVTDISPVLERAERCIGENEQAHAQLLSEILAYAQGCGSEEKLRSAVEKCSVDETTALTAAVAASCFGEMQNSGAVISFTGDVTISRYNEASGEIRFPYIYEHSGSFTYPFDKTMGVFANDTLSVVNFECVLSDYYKHEDKSFFFRGDPEYAEILAQSYIEVGNLENNHSRDYYQRGFNDTYDNLTKAGLECFYTNHPLTVDYTETAGGKIAFIAYHKKYGAEFEEEFCIEIIEAIKQHKDQGYCVVLNLHWGVEGSDAPKDWQLDCARRFIDSGADIIIGHHPHVLHGIEQYKGKYIAYSIGNFAFGGNAVTSSPETIILRVSFGLVEGEFTVTGISAVPCHITGTRTRWNDYQPMIVFGEEGELVIEKLLSMSAELPNGIKDINYSGI